MSKIKVTVKQGSEVTTSEITQNNYSDLHYYVHGEVESITVEMKPKAPKYYKKHCEVKLLKTVGDLIDAIGFSHLNTATKTTIIQSIDGQEHEYLFTPQSRSEVKLQSINCNDWTVLAYSNEFKPGTPLNDLFKVLATEIRLNYTAESSKIMGSMIWSVTKEVKS